MKPMTRLDELCLLIVDCEHKTAPVSADGYPSIRTPNVGRGRLKLDGVNRVDETTYRAWTKRAVPQAADLIIAREAPLGNVAIVPPGERVCLGQRTVLVRADPTKVDPAFLCYFLLGDYVQSRFHSAAIGATVPHLNMKDIRNLPVPQLPPISMQRRIASILGSYDDLIEVNRRRMALLEEMARRTFEEAIRTARECSKQGTNAAALVASTLGGDWGDDIATLDNPHEVRVVRGTDFRRIQAGDFSTVPTRYISERSFERRSLRPYDVIVENSINAKTRSAGTPLLVLNGVVQALGGQVIAASFCRLFRSTSTEHALVLFHFMDWLRRTGEMRRFQVVATNGIANFQSEQFMARAVIPLADASIHSLGRMLTAFSGTAFQQQISNLSEQRDLLLPRLVSGEISPRVAELKLEAVA